MSLTKDNNLFKQFPNRVLVETGCFRGDGIQLAMEAGFERIISIEIDPQHIEFCRQRFDLANKPIGIELIEGDSGVMLGEPIRHINEPITFWLDGHWMFLRDSAQGKKICPLLDELEMIRMHTRAYKHVHTILIDDMRCWYQENVGFGKKQIEEALMRICPQYQLSYFDSPVVNDILVAHK